MLGCGIGPLIKTDLRVAIGADRLGMDAAQPWMVAAETFARPMTRLGFTARNHVYKTTLHGDACCVDLPVFNYTSAVIGNIGSHEFDVQPQVRPAVPLHVGRMLIHGHLWDIRPERRMQSLSFATLSSVDASRMRCKELAMWAVRLPTPPCCRAESATQ